MPRFRFNLYNSTGFVEDEEGRELPDLAAARHEAMNDIRSILSEEITAGRVDLRGRLEIVDELAKLSSTVRFDEAVEIIRDEPPPC